MLLASSGMLSDDLWRVKRKLRTTVRNSTGCTVGWVATFQPYGAVMER
jgi:hypothetical protein